MMDVRVSRGTSTVLCKSQRIFDVSWVLSDWWDSIILHTPVGQRTFFLPFSVETRLQIECQTPCQKHSQMYFQKHIQPKCVGGGRGGQWLPTFCAMAIKLWPKDWQPQNHLSKSQIPCSTPSCDIFILNKIARWYGCFLRIEKHYPTVWEGVRNIFSPFLVEGIARLEGGIKCLPRAMSHMNPTPFQSTRGSGPAS